MWEKKIMSSLLSRDNSIAGSSLTCLKKDYIDLLFWANLYHLSQELKTTVLKKTKDVRNSFQSYLKLSKRVMAFGEKLVLDLFFGNLQNNGKSTKLIDLGFFFGLWLFFLMFGK